MILILRINDEEFTVRVAVKEEDKASATDAGVFASVIQHAKDIGFIIDPIAGKSIPWHAINMIEFVSLKEATDE